MKKPLISILLLFFVMLSYFALANNVEITLGKNTYCIPKRYSERSLDKRSLDYAKRNPGEWTG
ncbi:MAG: hypothetical protein SVR94_01795 [Pseudomonadota bacterium]|nr:hypothetical protein [Pseudomonadota bacterium]